MTTIVMDTANRYLVVAIYQNDECLASIQEEGNRKQSEYAIVYLQQLLNQTDLTLKQCDEMVITIGPGSYTGVRVALTIAKSLAAVLPIKIKCVSSLMAYAGFDDAISIIDARSKKMFIGIYHQGQSLQEEKMIDLDEFESYRQMYPDYRIVGDCSLVKKEEQMCDLADHIYRLSRHIQPCQDVDNLVPTYLKPVEAKQICK